MKVRNSDYKITGAALSKDESTLLLVMLLDDSPLNAPQIIIKAVNLNGSASINYSDYFASDLIKIGVLEGDLLLEQIDGLKRQLANSEKALEETVKARKADEKIKINEMIQQAEIRQKQLLTETVIHPGSISSSVSEDW